MHKPCWKRVLKIRMYLRTPLGPRAMWLEWGPDNIRGLATKNGHFLMFFHQKRKKVISLQTRTRISTLSFDKIVPVWTKNARALILTFFLHHRKRKTCKNFRRIRKRMTSTSLLRLGTSIQIYIIEKIKRKL